MEGYRFNIRNVIIEIDQEWCYEDRSEAMSAKVLFF